MPRGNGPPVTDAASLLPRSLCDRVDVLRGQPLEVCELAGGLTNRNYKVTTPEGSYVVRRSARDSGALAIDREHEYRNSVIAEASGVGAPVVAYLPEDATLVIGFLDGRTLTDGDFSRPDIIERVAASCRQLHGGGRFVNEFDMFEIRDGYLRTVVAGGYRLPEDYLDYEPELARIRGGWPSGTNPRWPATTICWRGTSSTTAITSG